MTDLVPVITAASTIPAVIFKPEERIVRLGDLGVARENLRWGEPPDDDIPTLAATLKAAGQLQPVTVRPGRGKKEQPWMALDGRRRRLALAMLLEAGDIDEDYPVRTYVETDPARQAAAVLLTNTAVPVHVADVIAAIGRMLKSKLTLTTMARALGYAEIDIRRLAALSDLPQDALNALRIGRMTLKQARLLARLPDKAERAELAEAALEGRGFQDWRILERLDDARVTTRDRRCALVSPRTYADAGGRTEADLFGELVPVLLDPDILTELWLQRARGIAAVLEAEGLTVHVTAGPEPELPDDLEALGYVYGGSLPAEVLSRYRAQNDLFRERAEAVRVALEDIDHPDVADLAIVDMIHARITADQTGCGGRLVTTLVLWPAAGTGVEVRSYTPEEVEAEAEVEDDDVGAESPGRSGLNREARSGKMPLSQAAGRAIARGLQKSPQADPEDRLLQLERSLRDHMRSTARDMQIVQELLIEVARAFFVRLPDAIVDEDPTVQAAVDRRIERLLDATAARIVAGRTERPVSPEDRSSGQAN